ncbi:D-3-phosphoglycerate dehydrogenase [Rhodococcus rhodochrous J38]|uniref:NAD(P)-dependent oxidoreductase n=1 Tax=Rhodococcus rhodochrous TaxID=1829 RepID=UPI0011ACDA0B|nr:NAD(P)-dependent oxidoreductase [Rhodococcus rhodochrous]TWH41962.1 D-3-phosphoglycerate dehydrogenase [Rhodococcus rhodochrous J38]
MDSPLVLVIEAGLYEDFSVEEEALANEAAVVRAGDIDTPEAVAAATAGAHALILGSREIPEDRWRALSPSVRVVVRAGAGLDNVDFDVMRERGIAVLHLPDFCVEEVATHALTLVLALTRKLPECSAAIAGEWDVRPHGLRPLSELTVGLIGGGGRTGKLLAKWMTPLVGEVLIFDPYADTSTVGRQVGTLGELLAESDMVSIHVPLTDETTHMIGADEFAAMRPGAGLVNIARGGVVDEVALVEALESGRLGGAAIDVFDAEPLPQDSPLRAAPNVILTPHIAWYSEASDLRMRIDSVVGPVDYLRGRALRVTTIAHDPMVAVPS